MILKNAIKFCVMALTVGIANGQAPMMPATASNSIARIDSLTFELLHSIPSHNPVKAIQTNYITKTKFYQRLH